MAVKKQTRDKVDLDDYLRKELAVLKNMQHMNLVAYIGAWNEVSSTQFGHNYLYIVTEYCQVNCFYFT